jgi:molecular chaperone HscB
MQWREQLEDADSFLEIGKLQQEVLAAKELAFARCETFLEVDKNWINAAGEVRTLMFMERFEVDIDKRRDQLENA